VPPQHTLEWLAIAQHHGLRTRLLDWTESLLVAAFFATEQGVEYESEHNHKTPVEAAGSYEVDDRTKKLMKVSDQPVIYGVRGLQNAQPDDDPFRLRGPKFRAYKPSHISARIAPQHSVFTVHRDPTESFEHRELICWTLDVAGTLDFKLALDACGITRASLFPGIDGIADALNWQYKWNRIRR
jgi:hypothetical protein